MEFGEDSLGSSKPGERPHRGPDYVLGSSDKVLMGPASKTPPTQIFAMTLTCEEIMDG